METIQCSCLATLNPQLSCAKFCLEFWQHKCEILREFVFVCCVGMASEVKTKGSSKLNVSLI